MSYYLALIKCYRSAIDFITSIQEVMQITWINNFFKPINMRKSHKKQILDHNVEKFWLIIRDDIDILLSTEMFMQANKNTVLEINFVNSAQKIREEFKWYIEINKHKKLQHSEINSNY